MKISSIFIQNFKELYQCKIGFSKDTALFVGANNSGKTSAMDALCKFYSFCQRNGIEIDLSDNTNI